MSDLAATLAELAQRNLLGRITKLKCGDVEVEMLSAVPRQVEDMDKIEDAQQRLREELLFASS